MPPENAGYMIAAYVVTAVILLGYVGLLWRRGATALRRYGATAVGPAPPRENHRDAEDAEGFAPHHAPLIPRRNSSSREMVAPPPKKNTYSTSSHAA